MRLLWYAGTSAALGASVVTYAFNQRANFYSAMVYLSQNNLSLMILINLVLLVYGSFVYGLQRICYGQLRPVEIEQLYEKAWFAVTETCLAMTIFREEVGAWFLVMFTALVTGKVWEWIGEGRVEILEQQPPTNPRLFHTRLSISLMLSVLYDTWLFSYCVGTVIQQARPNMMVMFLFEFAILTTCSLRTGLRYVLSLVETDIVNKQTRKRLEERRKQVRDQRADILRRRESDDAAESEAANQEELPDENDIDEMDIEVPGWESKGQWVLSLDLIADLVKLGVYVGFFAVLMLFYGLPIHIMRDLFMTTRSFLKRLNALLRYHTALREMKRYPDATPEDLANEDTCIICREEMHPWNPSTPGVVERSRPKKLPCGHILHFGCLKSWLERQQVCPTCRRSVVTDGTAPNVDGIAQGNARGQPPAPGQPGQPNGGANGDQPQQGRAAMRMFQLGPLRLGLAHGNPQNIQDMLAQRFGGQLDGANAPPAAAAVAPAGTQQVPAATTANTNNHGGVAEMSAQLHEMTQRLQTEIQSLQIAQTELTYVNALMGELQRLRALENLSINTHPSGHSGSVPSGQFPVSQQMAGVHPVAPFPALPHAMSPLPGFAHRMNSPSITRHTVTNGTASIPSGSPELPEGVVIPQGWSLMPLQRMDGPVQQPPVNQVQHQARESEPTRTAPPPPLDLNVPVGSHSTPSNANTEQVASENTPVADTQQPPPPVAAPTPIAPNWGGTAQLFADGGVGTSNSPAGPSSMSESTEDHTAENQPDGSDEKGKARAVTIEDADDE